MYWGQQSTASTRQCQQSRGRKLGKKQKLQKVDSERPAERSQCFATQREWRHRGKQSEMKVSNTEVTTPCHFGTRQRVQQLSNACKHLFKACFVTLHSRLKFCLPQSLTSPIYAPCVHEAYSMHVNTKWVMYLVEALPCFYIFSHALPYSIFNVFQWSTRTLAGRNQQQHDGGISQH